MLVHALMDTYRMLLVKIVINVIRIAKHVKITQIFVYHVPMHFCWMEIVSPVVLMDYTRIIQQWFVVYAKIHV